VANRSSIVAVGQLERELAYYRRECNDLGARLLRLQEEQSQAFRESRRSRTVAKLIREAYRLADGGSTPDEIGAPMLEIIVENALCDGAALLSEDRSAGGGFFRVTHAIGPRADEAAPPVRIASPPAFFFTTSRTPIEPLAYELTGILRLPYVLWAYDQPTGRALILGNQSESNVSRPFESGDQELIEGALSVYIDVLLRKQAEVELRAAKAAAERASDARARFLATLTHELRTPLNAVIGYSEMMVPGSRYRLTLEQREQYAEQVRDAGKHLLALIDGILDYSSLERALPSLTPEWVRAEQILRDAASVAGGAGCSREIEIRVVPPEPPLELLVDVLRFRQILHNLLGNAVKFSPAGGVVDLWVERQAGGAAVLVMRDNGMGMSPEDIPRALEPFQQIDNGLARGFGGAGLGLPIAKGLAEAHGGTLAIESELGRGTTVKVTLPPERVRERVAGVTADGSQDQRKT
jgi:signal transduction histidine kinase